MRMICIEGIDAVGKETVSKALERELVNREYRVKRVSFPIYEGHIGTVIKDILQGACGPAPELDPALISPLYTLDRVAYFKANIRDLFKNYDYLICDRSFYSNFMYQASKLEYTYDDNRISSTIREWISNNHLWEIENTGLDQCESIDTFVLTLSEKDSLAQLANRTEKDTNEANREYLNKCKRFISGMMSDGIRNYAMQLNGDESILNDYILNVHPIEVIHAEDESQLKEVTKMNVNKILEYLFPRRRRQKNEN